MRHTTPGRRAGIRAVLVAALAFAGAVLVPGAGLAATEQAAPIQVEMSATGPDTVIPGTHRCQNFGGTSPAGYRAGHCADVDQFVNSIGRLAVRGQGQAFCQVASTEVIVRCAGISQRISITNLTTGESISSNHVCGRYGGGTCPAGRFQNLSPGIYAYCGHTYYATVRSTVVLPVDAQTSRSSDFRSNYATLGC